MLIVVSGRVSIIIPAYNSSAYLCEAIDSALGQTHSDVEVVVVNDGSTDDTDSIIESRYMDRITYIQQPNAGLSAARNAGILASTGEFISFLDADDRILPEMAENLSNKLADHQECGLAYGGWYQINQTGERYGESDLDNAPSGRVFHELFKRGLFEVGTLMLRRSILAKSGLFDPALPQLEDRDMWMRVAFYADFISVPVHVAEIRSVTNSMSRNWAQRKVANDLLVRKMHTFLRSKGQPLSLLTHLRRNLNRHYPAQCVQDAFKSYWAADYSTAWRKMLRGVIASPGYLRNRGVWAVLVKSVMRGGMNNGS
ncbi:MAG: glycosyltransferase family A protein [Armatimonadota bacterium]|nr:glycosyltransferase family 2 protein [bacterium]